MDDGEGEEQNMVSKSKAQSKEGVQKKRGRKGGRKRKHGNSVDALTSQKSPLTPKYYAKKLVPDENVKFVNLLLLYLEEICLIAPNCKILM